jgi:hypothetical protein
MPKVEVFALSMPQSASDCQTIPAPLLDTTSSVFVITEGDVMAPNPQVSEIMKRSSVDKCMPTTPTDDKTALRHMFLLVQVGMALK